jgi:hypothetical protein
MRKAWAELAVQLEARKATAAAPVHGPIVDQAAAMMGNSPTTLRRYYSIVTERHKAQAGVAATKYLCMQQEQAERATREEEGQGGMADGADGQEEAGVLDWGRVRDWSNDGDDDGHARHAKRRRLAGSYRESSSCSSDGSTSRGSSDGDGEDKEEVEHVVDEQVAHPGSTAVRLRGGGWAEHQQLLQGGHGNGTRQVFSDDD